MSCCLGRRMFEVNLMCQHGTSAYDAGSSFSGPAWWLMFSLFFRGVEFLFRWLTRGGKAPWCFWARPKQQLSRCRASESDPSGSWMGARNARRRSRSIGTCLLSGEPNAPNASPLVKSSRMLQALQMSDGSSVVGSM